MDMFPDTASIREIQRALDDIIQQGVQNITRLIRATDPALTDPLQAQSEQTGGNNRTVRGGLSPRSKGQIGSREMADSSSLSSRLVRDGLLTPDLLKQLQKEWSKGQNNKVTRLSALDTEHPYNDNKGNRRKKKKWRGMDGSVPVDINN